MGSTTVDGREIDTVNIGVVLADCALFGHGMWCSCYLC